MIGNVEDTTGEQLTLQSRMSELAYIPPWIARLASRHAISASTEFAMNLCIEEALSNIIRHGYSGKPDHSIAVHFASPRENYFVFVVEDDAPPFNPVDSPELPPISSLDDIQVGGQGIRLLRRFASELKYQATSTGNRLSIGFSPAGSGVAKD
jgi:anti-sigma regulatory factor (Ser/Thr protein kinase)